MSPVTKTMTKHANTPGEFSQSAAYAQSPSVMGKQAPKGHGSSSY